MARRTAAEIERARAVAFVRARAAAVDKQVERQRLTVAEGRQFNRWLAALADDLENQLHL